jgi:fumarate reductase subunit D
MPIIGVAERAGPRSDRDGTRSDRRLSMKTRTPWFLVGAGLSLVVPTVWLGAENGSFSEDPFIFVAVAMLTGWSVVGALLASRNPRNPIGWLMIAFGLGFLVGGLSSEWSLYAYKTNPGGLPLGTFWGWLANWWFVVIFTPILVLLILYPTGRLKSRRWRPVLWGVIGAGAMVTLATMLKPGSLEIGADTSFEIANPTGVEALRSITGLTQGVLGALYVAVLIPACIAAVIWRFRGSMGEERQQIRWLAYVTAIGGVSFVVAALSGIGLDENERDVVNEIGFYVFFVAVGLGVPLRRSVWRSSSTASGISTSC